jgi:hypothetical protein
MLNNILVFCEQRLMLEVAIIIIMRSAEQVGNGEYQVVE